MTPRGAISSDIDTLDSIYHGRGCRRQGGYSYVEFRAGLERFHGFLDGVGGRATLFMVGNDFLRSSDHGVIRAMSGAGHEIANHTMTHAQGFRLLSAAEKERELAAMEEACVAVIGRRPVGFRSPGWNVGDDAAPILRRRGYLYDSSVFPTTLMPVMKLAHWWSMRGRSRGDRTTMGHLSYMFAPRTPYRAAPERLGTRGRGGLVEFPITVSPGLRIPVFATFLLATGLDHFRRTIRRLRERELPIQLMFHLSDFVDYTAPDLADQVPLPGRGQYVPASLGTPLARKMDLFTRAVDLVASHWQLTTLADWARALEAEGAS
jgi:hypothetical protein